MLGWEVIPRIGFGNFTISPHGLGIALGYFLGTLFLARRAREAGFSEDHAWNAAAVSVIGAILGARIAYVIGHISEFSSPIEWLQIYKGGISLVGGLLGGFLAAYVYVRRQKIDFLRLADLGAPGIALGIGVGRIGDLLIGDHLGKQTSGPWGWEYRGGELISPPPCSYATADRCIEPGMVVHQTALYDMIWSLVILGILLMLDRKPRPRGFLVLTWASLYAAGRIVTDFTRVDKHWFGLGLTGSQLTSIAVLALCSYLLVKRRKMQPAPAGVPVPAASARAESGTEGPAEAVEEKASPVDLAAEGAAAAELAPAAEPRLATGGERFKRRGKAPERPPGGAGQETRLGPETQITAPSAPAGAREEATAPARPRSIPRIPEGESVFRASRERARSTAEPGTPASRSPVVPGDRSGTDSRRTAGDTRFGSSRRAEEPRPASARQPDERRPPPRRRTEESRPSARQPDERRPPPRRRAEESTPSTRTPDKRRAPLRRRVEESRLSEERRPAARRRTEESTPSTRTPDGPRLGAGPPDALPVDPSRPSATDRPRRPPPVESTKPDRTAREARPEQPAASDLDEFDWEP